MLKKVCGFSALQPWKIFTQRCSSSTSSSIDAVVHRGLKEHYVELSKMTPPPVCRSCACSCYICIFMFVCVCMVDIKKIK